MSEEKVFLGKVKSVETQFGDILKISFGEEDLKKLYKHKNVAGWSNWEIKKSKSGTMYMELDTWVSKERNVEEKPSQTVSKPENDNLPF